MKKWLSIAVLGLIALYAFTRMQTSGIALTLKNVDTVALKAVDVHVTGTSYQVGELAPGTSKTINIRPVTDSHIELTFAGGGRLKINCYFSRGYRGKIAAGITAARVVSVDDQIKLPP